MKPDGIAHDCNSVGFNGVKPAAEAFRLALQPAFDILLDFRRDVRGTGHRAGRVMLLGGRDTFLFSNGRWK